jgi:YVTN family beta-propeller protein
MFENTVSVMDKEQNKVIKTVQVGEIPNGIRRHVVNINKNKQQIEFLNLLFFFSIY